MCQQDIPERRLCEYREANTWWQELSKMRRRDMAFLTAAQAAFFTIIGDDLLSLTPAHLTLSIIGFLIAVIGINNERRLYAYLRGFRKRAEEIEGDHDLSLIQRARKEVAALCPKSVPSTVAFMSFYGLFALSWVVTWILNA